MSDAANNWAPKRFMRLRIISKILATLIKNKLWHSVSSNVVTPFSIPEDYFGINIATQQSPSCDDYVFNQLHALELNSIRLNLSYADIGNAAQRLLDRALHEGFTVLLCILPPPEQAKIILDDAQAQQHWRAFILQLFEQYNTQKITFEIGNTPNRKKWSGWTYLSYLQAWSIAHRIAKQYDINLVAANVSDFEPLYNLAYFNGMAEQGSLPDTHSDNLFVERVVEPEAFDHRLLGRCLSSTLKFNLIKKARTLADISRQFGINKTIVSYTTWTLERLVRWSDTPEQKQADYLCRYLILAAASNTLDEVYWGPLIDHRDGIIDDKNTLPEDFNRSEYWASYAQQYPHIDNVAHYSHTGGKLADFRPRPAFFALKHLNTLLRGATCVQGISSPTGLSHFIFETNHQEVHVAWCRDGFSVPIKEVYPVLPESVQFYNVQGEKLSFEPASFTEQPTYFYFSSDALNTRPSATLLSGLPNLNQSKTKVAPKQGWQHLAYENTHWRGAVAFKNTITSTAAIKTMLPESLLSSEVGAVLRDTRNKIWTTQTETHGTIAIKLNRINFRKRIAYIFRDSKGRRHWNNANAMLRMGIKTPQPLAFFERHHSSGTSESYYVCAYLDQPFSARDVFTSMRKGEADYLGLAHDDLLKTIAEFVCHMHNRGVLHRDLSPGNILLINTGDTVAPHAIDIGRARTGLSLSTRQRMIDIMRICFILSWPNRNKLINYYNQRLGREVAWWWKIAVRYYIFKIESKRELRKVFKKKRV